MQCKNNANGKNISIKRQEVQLFNFIETFLLTLS